MAAKGQTQDQEPAGRAMKEVWQAVILEYDMLNADVTQSRKATALGVTDPVYIAWMKGESLPSLPNFVRLAELWGVPFDQLIYDRDHPAPLFTPGPPRVLPSPPRPPEGLTGDGGDQVPPRTHGTPSRRGRLGVGRGPRPA